jgi:hypothetical protein
MMQYWQQIIVILIVMLAALHFCAKYLPASWRQRVVYLLGRRGARAAKVAGWLASGSGCGAGCSSCKSAHPCSAGDEPEKAPRRVIRLHMQSSEPNITACQAGRGGITYHEEATQ